MTAHETVRAAGASGAWSKNGVGVAYEFIIWGSREAVTRAVLALGFGFDAGRRSLVTELHSATSLAGMLVTPPGGRASATISVSGMTCAGYGVG